MRQWIRVRFAFGSVAAALAVICLLSGSQRRAAEPEKAEEIVKLTATADKPGNDGRQVVTLTINVAKGWHIYANPVGHDDLASVQTTIAVTAKVKPEEVKVDYPAGKEIKDAVVGNYLTYEEKVPIKITVRRAKDDNSPLELTVKYQACCHIKGQEKCLLPATAKVTVPK